MIPDTIHEQSEKIILPNNEHDFTLFKPMEPKQMHQHASRCKSNKHIETCKYKFHTIIFVEQHSTQDPITQRRVQKNSNQLYDF
jgi:hypothetical protein